MNASKLARKRILLIDDDVSLLVTLGDFLRHEGYDLTAVESAERGLDLLENESFDLIVLDMSMPGMGGKEFLERITDPVTGRVAHPVLVLTARANMAEFFARTQVDGFVAKPCDPADLLLEIGRIIFLTGGGRPAETDHAAPPPGPPVLLGESDKKLNHLLRGALAAAGFEVETVFSGPDVLEAAILSKPRGLVLNLSLAGMKAGEVLDVLGRIPATGSIPAVVYGPGSSGLASRDGREADPRRTISLEETEPAAIVEAVKAALPGDSGD